MMKLKEKRGFTLIELMIVVAIIGLLAAIAVPNIIRMRTDATVNACKANIKQIESAKAMWAIDNPLTTGGTTVNMTDLVTTYIKNTPMCGTYSYTPETLSEIATCDSGATGHEL